MIGIRGESIVTEDKVRIYGCVRKKEKSKQAPWSASSTSLLHEVKAAPPPLSSTARQCIHDLVQFSEEESRILLWCHSGLPSPMP
jgi:hypothetical protein